MTRRTWIAGLLLAGACALPALAGGGKVALITASVTNGASGNGPVVTDAIRANLEKHGFSVLPAGKVESALKDNNLGADKRLTDADLVKVREATGAEYVVYPRVLSVGQSLSADGVFQANVLVNVLGKTGKGFVATQQVGQEFKSPGGKKGTVVITRGAADEQAQKLLESFYKKAK